MIWHPQALILPPATRRSADRIYTQANQARPPAPSLAVQAASYVSRYVTVLRARMCGSQPGCRTP